MAHISSLCRIVLLVLLCSPVYSEEQPTMFRNKMVNALCATMSSFTDFVSEKKLEMLFMGKTASPEIFDSIWKDGDEGAFLLVRFVYPDNEACLLSSGDIEYINLK